MKLTLTLDTSKTPMLFALLDWFSEETLDVSYPAIASMKPLFDPANEKVKA